MEKVEYAIAKFKYSKNDFYAVEIIKKFKTYEQASNVFSEKNYANSSGGTWQEAYEYQIIDIKDDILYYHNGGKIETILECSICSNFKNKEYAFQKYGSQNSTHLPKNTKKLTVINDFKQNSGRLK